MAKWKPKEIIIHENIRKDPVTDHVLERCKGVPIKYVRSGTRKEIVTASEVLSNAKETMLDKILAGKTALYIAPANNVVDLFTMPDDRMMCPHFERLKLASNGCFYQCDWCYLKLTYAVLNIALNAPRTSIGSLHIFRELRSNVLAYALNSHLDCFSISAPNRQGIV